MNDSLFEALMVGVNTFIFIIALTAGITLMGQINEMVEYTQLETSSASTGSLIESYGDTAERTYTGAEIYALYGQYKQDDLPEDITIKVKTNGAAYNISEHIKKDGLKYLSKTFVLDKVTPTEFLFVMK